MIKRDYLSFHQVFEQRVQFKSHQRRIAQVRGSSYNDLDYSKLINQITGFQQRMRKRNHQIQDQQIQAKNSLISQRIRSIQNTEPKLHLNDLKLFSTRKQFQLQFDREVSKQNSRLRERIQSMYPQINLKSMNQDFEKHQITLERMQRFKKKNNRCVLKSLERIENCESQQQNKYLKYYTQTIKTEPDQEYSAWRSNTNKGMSVINLID
ncbi:unnamed protein product (macronuclear) [Paramecium tetraurelia]|uniref:Uncharacterized protein n=1 Tax=Paramecium tetraurelia TaxID=5888 RepID=A0EB93_PARTE|nr:uncharacterized protein GSPATT00025294001 [Paramecium tetraurelia]CAK92560.1 unnamed protein product [Paramecium tetraurelia]|eukprot:XP_001459957.1 hypothetical protein (macronuclear) [Paramecium tetraurelia strain d4-2]